MTLLGDDRIYSALTSIPPRADQQTRPGGLADSFYGEELLDKFRSDIDQVCFGRRGSGKTHLLNTIVDSCRRANQEAVYIDLRQIGSAGYVSGALHSPLPRAVAAFRDILLAVYEWLFQHAADNNMEVQTFAQERLNELLEVINDRASEVSTRNIKLRSVEASTTKDGLSLEVSAAPKVGASLSSEETSTYEIEQAFDENLKDNLVFSNVIEHVESVLGELDVDRLLVVLDEWSNIPLDVQPLLADFLRRTFLASAKSYIVIGAVRDRTELIRRFQDGERIGMEVGHDIQYGADLDEHYVVHRSDDEPCQLRGLLHKQLLAEVGEALLESMGVVNGATLAQQLFQSEDAAIAASIASGGVARDYIKLIRNASIAARWADEDRITRKTIDRVAVESFRNEKRIGLLRTEKQTLDSIVDYCLGSGPSIVFFLDDADAPELVTRLFDERAIHAIRRSHFDPTTKNRFAIYAVDLGAALEHDAVLASGGVELFITPSGSGGTVEFRGAHLPMLPVSLAIDITTEAATR